MQEAPKLIETNEIVNIINEALKHNISITNFVSDGKLDLDKIQSTIAQIKSPQ